MRLSRVQTTIWTKNKTTYSGSVQPRPERLCFVSSCPLWDFKICLEGKMCRKTGMKSYLCQVYLVPGTGYCEVLFCLPSGEVHHKLQRVGHSKIFLVDLSTRYLRNTRLPLRQPSSLVNHKHSQKKNKGETDRVCVLAATSTTCWAVACVG